MFLFLVRLCLACMLGLSTVTAQDTALYFTSGVTNPAPTLGEPFTLTWAGGQANETVYIVLNYLFPDTPNQIIPYIETDILSDAPNNGSWTWTVPLTLEGGRYYFSIGENPLLQSGSTAVFTIVNAVSSYVPPAPATTNTAYQSYNGCGLPPLPDYTYTGYQPPCTTTVDGHVETLYPIVPASDSSLFFSNSPFVSATSASQAVGSSPSSPASASTSTSFNTAFAPGVFAQALQCSTSITPTTTRFVVSGTTTILSLVACSTASEPNSNSNNSPDLGVCHSSGYATFSVRGTSSVCCPTGWSTTPLNTELFCFTSIGQNLQKRERKEPFEKRQVSTETLEASPSPLIAITGLAFTTAGVVRNNEAATATTTTKASGSSTGSIASATGAATNGGSSMDLVVLAWSVYDITSIFLGVFISLFLSI